MLAVACSSKLMIICKAHSGSWAQVATLTSLACPLSDLQLTHTGLPIVTAGTQIGILSNTAHTSTAAAEASQHALVQVPLAHLALEVGGPLPEYAPAALALLVARGRMQAAGQVIRNLLAWLRLQASQQTAALSPQTISNSKLDSQLLPDTGLEALLGSSFLKELSDVISVLPLSSDDAFVQDGSSEADSQQAVGPSPAPTDPFAFDSGAFGPDNEYNEAADPPAATSADPYAFDAGAFGASQEDAQPQQEEQQRPQAANTASTDRFAFNMGAFSRGDDEEQSPPEEQHQQAGAAKDPFAFDAGTFGFGNDEPQQPEELTAAASDPYAFDAGAFGMPGGDAQAESDDRSAGSKQGQAGPQQQAPAADPFAFNPGAFGFSGEEEPQLMGQKAGNAAADPFAFNPDAFGFGGSCDHAEPLQQEDSDTKPQVVPAETAKPLDSQDPFAFNAGAFGLETGSASDAQHKSSPSQPSAHITQGVNLSNDDDADNGPMQTRKPAPATAAAAQSKPVPARQTAPSQPSTTAASQQKQSKPQIHRPKAVSASQAQAPPLSSDELQELQQLLHDTLVTHLAPPQAAEQPQSPMSPASAADDGHHNDTATPAVLPPGLTAQQTLTMLNIANMLCKDPLSTVSQARQGAEPTANLFLDMAPVDWAALDASAQKMVRSVQLATCSNHLFSGKPRCPENTPCSNFHRKLCQTQGALPLHTLSSLDSTFCKSPIDSHVWKQLCIWAEHHNTRLMQAYRLAAATAANAPAEVSALTQGAAMQPKSHEVLDGLMAAPRSAAVFTSRSGKLS